MRSERPCLQGRASARVWHPCPPACPRPRPLRPRCPMTLHPTATDRQQASRIAHAPVPILRAPRPRPCWLGAGQGSRPAPSASSPMQQADPISLQPPCSRGEGSRGLGVLGSWGLGLWASGFGFWASPHAAGQPPAPLLHAANRPAPSASSPHAAGARPLSLPVRKWKAVDIQTFACFTEQFA